MVRASLRLILMAFAAVAVLLHALEAGSWGRDYQPVDANSGLQLGFEIEVIGHTGLRNLLSYYDFVPVKPQSPEDPASASDVIRKLKLEDVDSYLTPETFDLLPADLQSRLTGGKKLDAKLEIKSPEIKIPTAVPATSPPPAKKVSSPTGLILPDDYNLNEGRRDIFLGEAKPTELDVPVHARNELEWEKVVREWKKIDIQDRQKFVDLNRLSPMTKARLVMDGAIPANWLRPKTSLPENIKDLLSRLNATKEGSLIEFKLRTPVSSKEAYKKDLYQFAELMGIHRYIEDPSIAQAKVLEFSYHMHVSLYQDEATEELADAVNRLRLTELAVTGRGQAALQEVYGYGDIHNKGLVRLVGPSHLESRTAVLSPDQEVDRLTRWLSIPRADAIKEINDQIVPHAQNLKSKLLAAGEHARTVKGAAERAALSKEVSMLFTVLEKSKAKIDLKELMAQKPIVDEFKKLNASAAGWKVLRPHVTGADDLRKNFSNLARAYVQSGEGKEFFEFIQSYGIKPDEALKRILSDAKYVMGIEQGFDSARFDFLRSSPENIRHELGLYWMRNAPNYRNLKEAFGLFFADQKLSEQTQKQVAAAYEKRMRDVSKTTFEYLDRIRLTIPRDDRFRKMLSERVLDHVTRQRDFDLSQSRGIWFILDTDARHLRLLRRPLTARDPDISEVVNAKRMLYETDPARLSEAVGKFKDDIKDPHRDFHNLFEILSKEVMNGAPAQKQRMFELAADGVFDGARIPFGAESFYKTILTKLTDEKVPTEKQISIFRKLYRKNSDSGASSFAADVVQKIASKNDLSQPWRRVLLEEWDRVARVPFNEDINFYRSSQLGEQLSVSRNFLKTEIARGGEETRLAQSILRKSKLLVQQLHEGRYGHVQLSQIPTCALRFQQLGAGR